jgi:hypothetical protein
LQFIAITVRLFVCGYWFVPIIQINQRRAEVSIKMATSEQERQVLALISKMFPKGLVPADHAKHVIGHPKELPVAILGMMSKLAHHHGETAAVEPLIQTPPSEWRLLFGHLGRMNHNFIEANFPLEPRGRIKPANEHRFNDHKTGVERLELAALGGLELTKPRATGEWLKDNWPKMKRKVVGCGVWRDCYNQLWVPVFDLHHSQPRRKSLYVDFRKLDSGFDENYVWLLSPMD